MDALLLVGLLVSSGGAIVTAKTKNWKLLNIGVILMLVVVGLVLGAGLGEWHQPLQTGAYIAVPLGIVGALKCWRGNRVRDKHAVPAISNE
jgi:hypothetical protein